MQNNNVIPICKICGKETIEIFKKLMLNKYNVQYFRCTKCGFIFTEKPYWLDEAYESAISDIDVGALTRSINNTNFVEQILIKNFDYKKDFLDYGGGYGVFTRLMRDKGFSFYSSDLYCKNLFASYFDSIRLKSKNDYELITAFELFEHLLDPIREVKNMLTYSDTILFSTELQPSDKTKELSNWWYFVPETGQHIALYSLESLKILAKQLNLNFYTSGNYHILTKKTFNRNILENNNKSDNSISVKIESLTTKDFIKMKEISKEEKVIDNKKTINVTKHLNEIDVDHLFEVIAKIKIQLAKHELTIQEKAKIIETLEISKNKVNEENNVLIENNNKLEKELNENILNSNALRFELFNIKSSKGWKFTLLFRKYFNKYIPYNTIRRKIVKKLFKISLQSYKLLRNLKRHITGISYRSDKVPSNPRRNINNSKKIVYIGHSYHIKTKSTEFLTDYLKKFYEVEIVLDNSWKGDPYPDLSFIDDSYHAVIFFEQVPSMEILDKINNTNLIFFPMYDGYGNIDLDFWKKFSKLKIFNFSSTLHEALLKYGFETEYAQFFPKSTAFKKGNRNEAFFWQRVGAINFDTIKKLLGDTSIKVHIHKAVDPGQVFNKPSKEDEKKYKITYSDWFEKKEDIWNKVIDNKAIYFSPRVYEGIGMSFLEAMAKGKVVIASDNPTMNEYIVNGVTGYLYDPQNPKQILLSDLENIQKATYKYMNEGYAKWEKNKEKIIKFIEQP